MDQDLQGSIARLSDPLLQEGSYPAGTLPSPEALRQYDALVPGAAERIFRLAEDQAQYRYQLETARVKGETTRAVLAMCFSAVIAFFLVTGGIVVALSHGGDPGPGVAIILFGVVLLAGVFLYTNTNRRTPPQAQQPVQQRPARVGRAYDPHGFDL